MEVELLPSHWVLDAREHRIYRKVKLGGGSRRDEAYFENFYLVLTPDGRLMEAFVHREQNELINGRGGLDSQWVDGPTGSAGLATEATLLRLDRSKRYKSYSDRSGGWIQGDNRFDGRVFRHAKGVGINLALRDLLQGRDPTLHTTKAYQPQRR